MFLLFRVMSITGLPFSQEMLQRVSAVYGRECLVHQTTTMTPTISADI